MSAGTPPNPDGPRWVADPVSRNGATAEADTQRALRLVVLGYITALAIPPIGVIVGIVIAVRPQKAYSRHWMWIVVIGLIAAVVWALVLASGAATSTTNELS
jgi:hypothetical protein